MTGPIHEIGSDIPPRAAEGEPPATCSVIHAGGSADHHMGVIANAILPIASTEQ